MTTESEDETRPEVAAFKRLRATGDAALREQIISEWLWLPGLIGKSYYRRYGKHRGWTVEDYVNQGIVGLIMAIDEYDPDGKHRNTRFHTLASWRIRDELRDISDAPTLVNIPALAPLEAPAWLVGARETTQALPILREMEQMAAPGPTVEDTIIQRDEEAEFFTKLDAAMLLLSERQKMVVRARVGLLPDRSEWSYKEIGALVGCSESTARREMNRAREMLRTHLATVSDGALVLRELHELEQRRRSKRAKTRAAA